MTTVRKTLSMPAALANRLEREAKLRDLPLSTFVCELLEGTDVDLPYAGLIDDDPDLSLKIDEIIARAGS